MKSIIEIKNNRLICNMCNSIRGFYRHKYRRGSNTKKWSNTFKCVNCGSKETRTFDTNIIKSQKINKQEE